MVYYYASIFMSDNAWRRIVSSWALNCVQHSVPAVRFQIARGLVALYVREETREEFWETVGRMLKAEPTSGVVLGLLQSLGQIAGREPARTMSVRASTSSRTIDSQRSRM